jgi:hypothetical protein
MSASRFVAALLVVASVAGTAPVAAQQDPRLVDAVRVAREGMADSARAITARLLATTASTSPLYPELLYTIAIVASNEQDRRLYLRRVTIEHSNSPWADNALLGLAQLDYAGGNPDGTMRNVDQLISDYPGSDVLAEASFWGSRAAFDRNDPRRACAWLATGIASVGADVELRNRLDFANLRCRDLPADTAVPAPPPPAPTPAPAPAPPPPAAVPPPVTGPGWYVQVAAMADSAALDRVAAALREMGYQPSIVAGPGTLQKIRAGRWSSRALAQAEVARIRARFGGQPFVVQDP